LAEPSTEASGTPWASTSSENLIAPFWTQLATDKDDFIRKILNHYLRTINKIRFVLEAAILIQKNKYCVPTPLK